MHYTVFGAVIEQISPPFGPILWELEVTTRVTPSSCRRLVPSLGHSRFFKGEKENIWCMGHS